MTNFHLSTRKCLTALPIVTAVAAGPLVPIATVCVAVVTSAPVYAEQRSLDLQISKTYDSIDTRIRAYEGSAKQIRDRMEDMAADIQALAVEFKDLKGGPDTAATRNARRSLNAQATEKMARYVAAGTELLNQLNDLVSSNMQSLSDLAGQVRRSKLGKQQVARLETQIAKNRKIGQSMRQVLAEVKAAVGNNPAMLRHALSLNKTMHRLDSQIAGDKVRLSNRAQEVHHIGQSRLLDAIDRTLNDLEDTYTSVLHEQAVLKDVKDQLKLTVNLGELEMTNEVLARVRPLTISQSGEVGAIVPRLNDMLSAVMNLSDRLLPAAVPEVGGEGGGSVDVDTLISSEFKNF